MLSLGCVFLYLEGRTWTRACAIYLASTSSSFPLHLTQCGVRCEPKYLIIHGLGQSWPSLVWHIETRNRGISLCVWKASLAYTPFSTESAYSRM